jgi:hypothetical protein
MDIKEYKDRLTNIIKEAQKNSVLELECVVKSTPGKKITNKMFNDVVKKIKGIPDINMQSNSETLDIFIEGQKSMRYTINGNMPINKYCKSNNLSTLNGSQYELISKKSIQNIDVGNYNIRFNLKSEDKKPVDLKVLNDWAKLQKTFRYKKRFSYITNDKLFSFDLTVVKSSNKIIKTLPNIKKQKREVEDFLKKFVVKPIKVKDISFDKWWKSLKNDDMVEIRGKTVENYISSKTLQSSSVLTNELEYEIELEYLGNKFGHKSKYTEILDKMINNVGIILQGIQQSNFIISNSEKQLVKTKLKELLNNYNFTGPQNVTLEMKHLVKHNYIDYSNLLSIRRQYSVTEKADGERNICVVLDNDSVYFINRKNDIKSFGCKLTGLANTVFDGELIMTDKEGKNINLFAIFDLYVHKGEDLRTRILNRTIEEKEKGALLESRQEVLKGITFDIKSNYDILFINKKYYYGDITDYDDKVNELLISKQLELETSEEENSELKSQITKLEADTKIFSEIEKVLNKDYIYKIDGLVFTPRHLAVGDEMNGRTAKFDGRWNKLFKWKPPDENTIDFRVDIKKLDGEDEIRYMEHRNKVVAYKVLILNVGYHPEQHTKHNSCRVLNEELQFKSMYGMVPFRPHNPYVKNIELAYIPIVNSVLFCKNKEIITSDSIVEFSYDVSMGEGFCWIPMRVRNNLMPNDFITATNVWRSIHQPITKNMILTGITPFVDEDVYYVNKEKSRSQLNTKPLADFHSYIKKNLITENSKKGHDLLDISCGKGGDLSHWVDSKLNNVVGIDISRDNLENVNNGICNRILEKQLDDTSKLLKNILVIWGDSSKLLNTGAAANDDLNAYYLDVLYKNVELANVDNSKLKRFYGMGSNQFNVISSQFSFHYFFESEVKLDIFLTNVSTNLKKGGHFIGTCFDGSKVFDELKRNNGEFTVYEKGNLLVQIIKKYEDDILHDDSTSIGMPINVYMESIGKTITEWLVNFNFVAKKALTYGLELKKLESFEDYHKKLTKSKIKYGDSGKMTDSLKMLSFLNTTFIFEKI